MSKYLLSQGTINGLSSCAEYETVNVIKTFLRKFFENTIQYIKKLQIFSIFKKEFQTSLKKTKHKTTSF